MIGLYEKSKQRLKSLSPDKNIEKILEVEGISRRDFLKWVSVTTAMLGLPGFFEPLVAQSINALNKIPVIWMNYQDCAGNSESILRASKPTIDEIIINLISLEFHELLMAPSGTQAENQLEETIQNYEGEYLLFVEGSIPLADNGVYGTIGPSGETYKDHLLRLASKAKAIIAVGNCASFGGVVAANPNPTGATGVMGVDGINVPIINLPACPVNPETMIGVLIMYALTGELPELDSLKRPLFAYASRIHDRCERRVHFDAGEFVESFGDNASQSGYCLYKVGCKGPFTFNNCPTVKFNDTSWPVDAGHGCIGCSEPGFVDKFGSFEKPFVEENINPAAESIKDIPFVATTILAAFSYEKIKNIIRKENG
ncbi:hydrogenase small subunit [Caminibacter mediatlanticus]|uniref:NI/FE-HYDROGENASE SMALL SUBUNIT n=1 Tax=Caminibacter mediatlanticus TB-2 TaxID=391592 RepID=A0AAI9F2G0_9BACT|nr:hydrogenase small subunit [Caminibacter mediatlanticus]EDM23778.1 NI/FE-HYDROGENASE SMALL SUBUNIT [Caminibacter mediatlanticus TB-2]